MTARPKEHAVYSEPYRRLVAMLPCCSCGIDGYSQAAHPPPTAKGRKEDDRSCFPLCCTRVGVMGCHASFDQYKLITKDRMRAMAATWAQRTRAAITAAGGWPKKLPTWSEE